VYMRKLLHRGCHSHRGALTKITIRAQPTRLLVN
jgi:hypothetical protein